MIGLDHQHVSGRDQPVRVAEILDMVGVELHVALSHLDRFAQQIPVAGESLLNLGEHSVETRYVGYLSRGETGRRQKSGDGDQDVLELDHSPRQRGITGALEG
jgi:hypothetical protein